MVAVVVVDVVSRLSCALQETSAGTRIGQPSVALADPSSDQDLGGSARRLLFARACFLNSKGKAERSLEIKHGPCALQIW